MYRVYVFEKESKCTYDSINIGILITFFTIRQSVLTDSVNSFVFYKLCSKVCESISCLPSKDHLCHVNFITDLTLLLSTSY